MKLNNFFLFLVILLTTLSCSKDQEKKMSVIKEKSLDLQVLEEYQEGLNALKSGDVLYAAKKFNNAEILYPQSIWAPKASIMAAYSYYSQEYYVDAIAELKRFIKLYPENDNIDYAHYILAIIYYEQIVDEKKDLKSILNAKKSFQYLVNTFPNTDYALDSKFKLDMVNNILASKEMYIANYYHKRKKWIAAINRFKTVINEYETTVYVEEALYRMVEINYILGLDNEANKYAKLLGYNYQSSEWYKNSYRIINKEYKINEIKKNKKKNIILSKIKSLFN